MKFVMSWQERPCGSAEAYEDAQEHVLAMMQNWRAPQAVFASIENIIGTSHDDVLAGNTADNTIYGLGGDDILRGRGGFDVMTGGSGSDTFLIQPGIDVDRVQDHTSGVDTIRLLSFAGIDDLADLQAVGTDDGANSSYDLGGGDTLVIIGHNVADLQNGDFLFS